MMAAPSADAAQMAKVAEAAVKNDLDKAHATSAAVATGISAALKVQAPVADAPLQRKNSQPRGSTLGPEVPKEPAAKQPLPNDVIDEITGESPEPDVVQEIAEAAPVATVLAPVVADAPLMESDKEPDDYDEPFSDVPERPAEVTEELPKSSTGAVITAQAAAAMSRPPAVAAGKPEIYPPCFGTPDPPAEPEAPAMPSPVAPALSTAQAAPSMPQAAAQAEPEILAEPQQEAQPPAPVQTAPAGDANSPAIATPAPAGAPAEADGISLKELPNLAAEAAKQASQAYVEAGKQAQVTLKDLLSLRDKEGPPVTLTVDQIATAAFFLVVASQLLLLPLFLPSTFRLLYSLVWGLLVGLGLSYLFYYNRKRKSETNELLATNLGLKGIQMVAAGVPAVFNMSDEEKMEWLNVLIEEVWPYVDKGACQMIKDITAQMMPGILGSLPGVLAGKVRSVGFKHLTFGSAPMRVESIRVTQEGSDGLALELSVKWCGDPNITLAIEIPGGQKLCPRVLDISFAAKVRVVLRPLVHRLPGFVVAMATLPKPPLIKYRLDFGKALGGSVAPMAVTPVINYFLRGELDRRLVWPNRIVVPILQETAQDAAEVQKMMRRVRGMVRVCVLRGKQLKGVEPTDNALVELTTDTEYYESTPHRAAVSPEELAAVDGKLERIANTELVTWNHFIYLLVQEPESQMLRLEAFDLDSRGRNGKQVSASGRRSVGRALIKLNRVCKAGAEGAREPLPVRVQLGKADWGSPGGPGKGAGTVNLAMSYFPCEDFTREQVLGATTGIITIRLLAIGGLTPSAAGSVTAYASFALTATKRDKQPSWKTARKYWTLAGHVAQLKARIARLEAARQRDLREGDTAEAEAKAEAMRALQAEIDGAADKARITDRRVTLDYSMETQALHAFHRVTEKVMETRRRGGDGADGGGDGGDGGATTDGGAITDGEGVGAAPPAPVEADNCVLIKVYQEGRVKKATETLGVAEVPVSRIKNGYCLNPLTGKSEYGLHICKWENFDPDSPGRRPPESEWGFPVEGSAGVKVWAILRWVPCIEASPHDLDENEEEAFVNALPSTIKPVQSAWQVK